MGVILLINEGAPTLNKDMVCAYLTKSIANLEFINALLYLSDSKHHPNQIPLVVKDPGDIAVSKFHHEFLMMLNSFKWENGKPINRNLGPKELLAQITMDSGSRNIYETWSTGWRLSDDPMPIPSPSYTIAFVPADKYESGLKSA